MNRDIAQLAASEYDLLIVGAGIYGACAAWDAALRGLRVALIERGDFGGATSQNSQKIIHGGLRYLQKADFKRMRESIRERRTLMKIAPHFVHPFPCVMPTYGHFTKGREALAVAMLANDLIGFDRNRIDDPQKRIPRGKTISRQKVLELLPGIPTNGLTGGAVWYDSQTHNSERLLLSFILGACGKGVCAANYVEAIGFLTAGRTVTGVKALDRTTGKRFEIRARVVLNASGPWTDMVLKLLDAGAAMPPLILSTALVIVTRSFIRDCGAGLAYRGCAETPANPALKGSRLYFVTPWRDVSLVGTVHAPYGGEPDEYRVTEQEILALLDAINAAYPLAKLGRDDVRCFYSGILPMKRVNRKTGEAVPLNHYRLVDHRRRHGWDGLITLVGVKYTTARDVAEKAVDLAMRKLRIPRRRGTSGVTPVCGGDVGKFDEFLEDAVRARPAWIGEGSMRHLVYHYGARYRNILDLAGSDRALAELLPAQPVVIGAEIVHAAREEMALTLADAVLRRTELGTAGCPADGCLRACVELMGRELGWDSTRKQAEIDSVKALYVPVKGEKE
ncbi:MAG: glycerol-3-phosphate dehydrogenase/oxidase [Candidatus Aureabacteria bacterium]|nr:glycerol-3-phosphate dehydrogenase/oxidase [Candidatus Auribacterota bacterium]